MIWSTSIHPTDSYFDQLEEIETDISLKKLHFEAENKDTGAATKARLDLESSTTPELVRDLIQGQVEQEIKNYRSEVEKLKRQLATFNNETNNAKNSPGGAWDYKWRLWNQRNFENERDSTQEEYSHLPKSWQPVPTCSKSRRSRQRHKPRQCEEEERKEQEEEHQAQLALTHRINLILSSIRLRITVAYGSLSDPSRTPNHNASVQLEVMPTCHYFSRVTSMAMHNLTNKSTTTIPKSLSSLIELGMKFFPIKKFTTVSRTTTLTCFWKELYVKTYYAGKRREVEEDFIPKMQVELDWEPNTWDLPTTIVDRYAAFAKSITSLLRKQHRQE